MNNRIIMCINAYAERSIEYLWCEEWARGGNVVAINSASVIGDL